eukprot:gene26676-biopygen17135
MVYLNSQRSERGPFLRPTRYPNKMCSYGLCIAGSAGSGCTGITGGPDRGPDIPDREPWACPRGADAFS